MKKLYFLVLLFTVGSVNAQDAVINFPDPHFKLKVKYAEIALNLNGDYIYIDANQNGEIEQSEALQVSWLEVEPSINNSFSSFVGIEYFTNLTYFKSGIYTGTTADFSSLINLERISLIMPNITSINFNENLKGLALANSQIPWLDINSLVNLESLSLSANELTSIDISGLTNLQQLSLEYNNLTTLDLSQHSNLKYLYCSDNQLTSLILPEQNQLEELWCQFNLLENLDLESSVNLTNLNCSYNQLTALDVTSMTLLQDLRCNWNQITNLNVAGLTSLINLECDINQLSSLDLTGLTSLKGLSCGSNALQNLDVTGLTSLNSLFCGGNLLQHLDLSPATSLTFFTCQDNNLISLNCKNGINEEDWAFQNNPNLQYICTDEEQIEVMKAYTEYTLGLDCEINSYCSFTPGGAFYTIEGDNKFDTNNNGCDAQDIVYPNLKLALTGDIDTGVMISDASGHYNYAIQAGTYTLAPVFENPAYFNVTPVSTEIVFPSETTTINQNFCISANQVYTDLEVIIIPTGPARPGFNANYKIILKNKGNIQQSGSVSFAYDDAVLDYIIAAPLFTTQAEGLLSWAFANLEPFETREINVTLNVNSPMETPAVNGDDVLTYNATITSDQVDELPLDNTFSLPQIVVNSFDPNDKTCLEGTAITPDMIGQYVHYMIRFENTGTFAAENIVVKDMIDTEKFDVSSLVALNGSHPYVTRITGNKVEFIFEGINLPFEDATNDGYVVFKIKTLPTLALGDSFSNTASIYFDFNHPIVTEPAVTTFAVLGTEDFVFNSYFTLYPNPTNGILNITSKQAIELQSISIYNVLGQMVVSVPNAKGVNNVDVSSLSTGNYFIKVVSDKGTSNAKFIKQ